MFKIAFRNIFRNTRRSLTTMMTIAVGTAAVLVFGAFNLYVTYGLQTSTVERSGHLAVYRNGYFDFGTGAPADWGISNFASVLELIRKDPVLAPMSAVVTPVQELSGVAGNLESGASKTFFGVGFVPSDRDRMKDWDEYGVGSTGLNRSGLTDDDATHGLTGVGVARILGLCARLHLANCPTPKTAPVDKAQAGELAAIPERNFAGLAEASGASAASAGDPQINLLSATAAGAPNVVTLQLNRVEYQGVKQLDDNYVGMNIRLAQELVYGRGEHEITGIVLQLYRTQDMPRARARLLELFRAHHLDLEVRDFTELNPFYTQALNLFRTIFSFIAMVIGMVVLFTVANAMGMSVVERTDEIGTTRALGVRRSGIRGQFLVEGAIIGVLGASVGAALAYAIAFAVNGAGLTWTPPGNAEPTPLRLYMIGAWGLTAVVWAGLIVVATLASVAPAARAARLKVVDALRHV
jgi:putative ABC transport system permease protein